MLVDNHIVCVFQDGNVDSFTAAWVLWKKYPYAHVTNNITTLKPSDIRGKDVYIFGSVTTLQSLIPMSKYCSSMIVFQYEDTFLQEVFDYGSNLPENILIQFDANKSLATSAWDFFVNNNQRPALFSFIEDKVLWTNKYQETRAITSAIVDYPFDFIAWDHLMYGTPIDVLVNSGIAKLSQLKNDVIARMKTLKSRMNIAGYDVPAIQVTPPTASEVCLELSQGEPFAACYWDEPDGRVFELVSTSGFDVSQLVHPLGGHGTRHEAHVKLPNYHRMMNA